MKTFDEINETMLYRCLMRIRPWTAPGIDGITRNEFRLSDGLSILARQLQNGTFVPSPCRRVWLPKPDGRLRPIAIPTIADRVVQRALSAILSARYEPGFSDASFGFRPRRSANQAVDRLAQALERLPNPVIVEFDIVSCFDRIRHDDVLGRLIEDQVDPRIVKLVAAFLRAPVVDHGVEEAHTIGSPQGGPLSPFIANLVLDRALDWWFPDAVRLHGWGDAVLARYADDFGVATHALAVGEEVRRAVRARLRSFGLDPHPEKTHPEKNRCVELRPSRPDQPGGRFEFLGWRLGFHEHDGGRRFIRRTSFKTIDRTLKRLGHEMRGKAWRQKTAEAREEWFRAVVRGHREYFGRPGNEKQILSFEKPFKHAFDRATSGYVPTRIYAAAPDCARGS
jgi:RNA-directed DNA polymerase